jgi:uncharacterized protein (DUF433 family)
MNLPEFLQRHPDGEIGLAGHRIGLYHIVHHYNEGYSPEMLVCQYPTLPLALIHKVIAFYLENRAEVDAYMTECRTQLEQQRTANPRRLDLDTLRRRLEAQQRAEASGSAAGV